MASLFDLARQLPSPKKMWVQITPRLLASPNLMFKTWTEILKRVELWKRKKKKEWVASFCSNHRAI